MLNKPESNFLRLNSNFGNKEVVKPQAILDKDSPHLEKQAHAETVSTLIDISNLSVDQLMFWVGQKLYPDVPIYNVASLFTIAQAIEPAHFRAAFQTLFNSSDAWRMVIHEIDGVPQYRIKPPSAYDLPFLDFSDEAAPEVALRTWATKRASRLFDLASSLIDAALIKLAPRRFIWYVNQHHLITDGIGAVELPLGYLSALYGQALAGTLPDQIDLPRFNEHIEQEQARRGSPQFLQAETYWQQKLADWPSSPTFYGHTPANVDTRSAYIPCQLGPERSERLRQVARQAGIHGHSLDAALFKIFATVLLTYVHRLGGDEKIALGVPRHNRRTPAAKQTLGLMMQTLPLHVMISPDDTFMSLLNQIAAEMSGVHQNSPYAAPNVGQSYDVLLNYQVARPPLFQGNPVSHEFIHLGYGQKSLALQVCDFEQSGQLTLYFGANRAIFTAEQRQRLPQHYLQLLDAFLENPHQSIHQANLLTAEERTQLLFDWNDTAADFPQDHCVHQLVEAQVEQTPDAVALVFEDKTLTYRALNDQANRLAAHLQTLGVAPDVIVGVCLERSLEMVIGLLAVLKAGAAYVPLDPAYPHSRLQFLVEDSGAKLIITQQHLVNMVESLGAVQIVAIDNDHQSVVTRPEPPQTFYPSAVTPRNLAYVIYTSGSTGQPKGVAVEHRSVVNMITFRTRKLLSPENLRVVPCQVSISFDGIVSQVFVPLSVGSKIILSKDSLTWHTHPLVNEITCAILVPSALEALLDNFGLPASVEVIGVGAEPVSEALINKLTAYPQIKKIVNVYGPTEATVNCTAVTLYDAAAQADIPPTGPASPPALSRSHVTIGKPISNTQIYLLDKHLQPVPVGVPGEIHVGGVGLARGYLNQPELTAEKFIANPFGPGRLYRTGDLARFRPDGHLEFLGRIDHQVKIRGYRIELGEIEAILSHHAAVEKCVVVAGDDNLGNKRLVAYVVSAQTLAVSDLRAYLQQHLPDYMVPAVFMFVDRLPLNANGKIDLRALPSPDTTRPELAETFVTPEGQVEIRLAEVWQDVLKIPQIGRHDNFAELGGHSLLALRIASRLQQAYEIDLPLRFLFDYPTIAQLAPVVTALRQAEMKTAVEQPDEAISPFTIPRRSPAPDYPLTFGQEGIFYVEQYQPDTGAYNIPAVWRLRGPLDLGALQQSLQALVDRHEALRTRFVVIDGRPRQLIQPTVEFKLCTVSLRALSADQQAAQVAQLTTQEAGQPFDLAQAPLLRGTVLHLAENSYVFLLTLHHIVGDGWSLGLLTQALSTAYAAFKAGQQPLWAELPLQYADFAVWQREGLVGRYDTQLAYWRQQLEDTPPLLNLPLDFPRPAIQRHEGDHLTAIIPAEVTQTLLWHSRQGRATLFMTLAAGFKLLLQRYTHRDDIIVGTPMVNRVHKELEPLIGYFLNALVLRTDLSGDITFQELLDRVRQVTLDAYANQQLPYEQLVQSLQLEPHLSYNPLFQVLINMVVPGENSELALSEMCVENVSEAEIDTRAKFDMTLYVRPVDDQLRLHLVYKTDLFRRDRMEAMLAQFTYLMAQVAENPQRPLSDYSLVTPAAQRQLPDPTAPLSQPRQPLVTAMIAHRAEQSPQHIALSQGDQSWTYAQLMQQAVRIAVTLQTQGVEPGDVVAIYAPRSFMFIAGLIGTWLMGGVVVLVDPNLPQERKQLILREAGAKHVIYVGDAYADDTWLTEPAHALNIIAVENDGLDLTPAVDEAAITLPDVEPDAPAYIFFTSGTTGTPKGILGSHQGLSHFVSWQGQTFQINRDDRAAHLTGPSFDVILRDILTPLTHGATLCLPDSPDHLDFAALLDWLARERITMLHTVPTLAQMWLQHASAGVSLPDLRWTFFAGEPLTDTLVQQWQTLCPVATLINLYGPTETTLAKCYYQVPDEPSAGIQPVGTPLPQTQVLILAPNGRLCGFSEVGEIVIRTPFRTRGYLKAGPADHRRFRPNHFRDEAQDILYYTGDLGRYRPDGQVEILGRLDDQIKIRGVRIEPNEIAATLAQHPDVKSCFVTAAQDDQQQTYLAAYVVSDGSAAPTPTTLQQFLSQKLPSAMVPAAFVMLKSLPVTSNGKIDRRRLPLPSPIEPIKAPNFVAPKSPIEGMLAEVWREVLGIPQVGIYDNFFQLGGHSLLAIQVISRLGSQYDLRLPLRLLFEHPTVAELALTIEEILIQELEP
ncbi:MAG: amino acid adenylation domain-containing protein [Anaerolineae bacterium]|nr:amino acid adenylation domain-containing protein [Anaerolineae bacterium]